MWAKPLMEMYLHLNVWLQGRRLRHRCARGWSLCHGRKLEGEATSIVSLSRIPASTSQLERNAGTSRSCGHHPEKCKNMDPEFVMQVLDCTFFHSSAQALYQGTAIFQSPWTFFKHPFSPEYYPFFFFYLNSRIVARKFERFHTECMGYYRRHTAYTSKTGVVQRFAHHSLDFSKVISSLTIHTITRIQRMWTNKFPRY